MVGGGGGGGGGGVGVGLGVGGDVGYNMGGGGESCFAQHSQVDRIMLRFRPIAPKPMNRASAFDTKADFSSQGCRVKRRYVRGDGPKKSKRRVVSEKQNTPPTLALLPEKSENDEKIVKESACMDTNNLANDAQLTNIWLNLNRQMRNGSDQRVRLVAPQPVRPVGSCVTVESVTCDGRVEVMGGTDEERKRRLEEDACPGFISDEANRVRWMNVAYRKMVRKEEEEEGGCEIMVWLVMKGRVGVELVEAGMCKGFACWVRLEYMCRKERNKLMVPCDVWKMDGGGFAWRLDVKAALTLGR